MSKDVSLPIRAILLLALLAGAALAGCSHPTPPPAGPSTTSITRHVVFRLNETTFQPGPTPQAALSRAMLTYDYKHTGETIDLRDLLIRYETADIVQKTAKFVDLTSKTTLGDQETVLFELPPDASPLTYLRIEREDGTVLATRDGAKGDWLTAARLPLPLGVSASGLDSWMVHAESALRVSGHGLEIVQPANVSCSDAGCPPGDVSTRIGTVDLSFNTTTDAAVQLQATRTDAQTAVSFDVPSARTVLNLALALEATFGNQTLDFGVAGSVTSTASTSFDLTFGRDREATSIGMESHVQTDGGFTSHGLPDEAASSFPPSLHNTEDVPREDTPLALSGSSDATLVAFLKRMWSLDLAKGDSFDFHWDGAASVVDYTTQVVAREPRVVGAATRETLRVFDRLHVTLKNTQTPREYTYEATSWVDAATAMPVYMQASLTQSVRAIDYPELRDAVERNVTAAGDRLIHWMDDGQASVRTSVFVNMTGISGNLTHAAVLEAGAARLIPALAALSMQRTLGPLVPGGRPDIPDVALRPDEDSDRILVQAAEAGADWSRIAVYVAACATDPTATVDIGHVIAPHQNHPADEAETHAAVSTAGCVGQEAPLPVSLTHSPVFANDYIAFCADGAEATQVELIVIDNPTGYELGSFLMRDIAVCH